MECLVFHLVGPMCSWGGPAVGTYRPTDDHPTKSGLIGILSASLGLDRSDSDAIYALSSGYEYVVASAGKQAVMMDFATVQTSSSSKGKEASMLPPRTLELSRNDINTIVIDRRFLCNACYSVFMIPVPGSKYSLEQLRDALEHPHFIPYLGRKSCPLSFPMCPTIESYVRLMDLITEKSFMPFRTEPFSRMIGRIQLLGTPRIYSTYPIDDLPSTRVVRRDDLPNRRTWTFMDREEFVYEADTI